MNGEDIGQHIAKALYAAPVSFEPFHHIYVENVFPEEFYKAIEYEFSLSTSFLPQCQELDRDIFKAPYEKRLQFNISTNQIDRQSQEEVWNLLWDSLVSNAFFIGLKRALVEELWGRYQYFTAHPRFRDCLEPRVLVAKHLPEYHLGPHTDWPEKIATCIFNFAERSGLDDIGTALYTPRQEGFRSNGRFHFEFDKFKLAKIVPFRPNSALLFARSDISFHGVEPLTLEALETSERRNIQYNLWDWGKRPDE